MGTSTATRRLRWITPALIVASLVLACTPETSEAPRSPRAASVPPAEPTAASDASVAEPAPKRRARAAHAASPVRPPPLGITAAMTGEPTARELGEARLVSSSCEKLEADEIDAELKAMRAAVDASFKEWHDGQPACWEQMREEALQRMLMQRQAPSAAFGAGGLGLSGVGVGGGGVGFGYGAGHGALAGRASVTADGVRSARRASGTNNQVAGVDEADIVKTDGKYVYLALNGALRIVEALSPRVVSETRMPGVARELFVEGDRAVVYTSSGSVGKRCTYGYDCTFAGDGSSTKVLVYDLTHRESPRLVRELGLSGSLMAARRIGNAVHTVVADNDYTPRSYASWPNDLAMCGTPEAEVRAKFARLKAENERQIRAHVAKIPTVTENGKTAPMCSTVLRTAIADGGAFTSVVSFDLANDALAPTTATLKSRPGAVFASGDALYLSVVHQKQASGGRWYSYARSADEVSEIHKFRIGPDARGTRYVGSGTVPGHVLNQFAMDEWYGYLRVATTKGRVPDPRVESVVSILAEGAGGNLTRIGAIDHIAKGEDIRSVRFDDDRGYVVTFKKTDPLFVLDLASPASPAVLGELKIPGFSTYMHRIDPGHLLSIGFDANDHGSFAYFDGVILQLFDVQEPTNPKLLFKEKIGTRGSSSEAATDHLAFNYVADEGLLAIPMTLCEGGGDGRNGDQLAFSGLLVYDVDLERGFTRLGGIDHGTRGVSCSTWWSNATSAVKRSVFLDDLVYSVASDRVKVQSLTKLGTDVADLAMTP